MDPQQQFCLKWNSFGNNLVSTFDSLFKSESLTDVTLFCEGVTYKAHKVILAACSKHFQDLFEAAPHCPSMIVILDGTSSSNMSALLEFMYKGEVHVSHENLSSFLKAAECLQVKGLSIEQGRIAEAHSQVSRSDEFRVESPSDRNSKSSKHSTPSSKETTGGSEASMGNSSGEAHPASTSGYSMSPYIHPYGYPERWVDGRKRQRGSPDAGPRVHRASVLRDGSKPEMEAFSPHSSPQPQVYHSPQGPMTSYEAHDTPVSAPAPPPVSSIPYDRSAAVESDTPPDVWRSNSCPQDLSVKVEPPGNEKNSGVKSEWNYNEMESNHPMEILPSNVWNCSSSTKISQAHKQAPTATTPDGSKKLQCPFCERLYGYETNLRAHIRQRHQGIRVPCPFCSRTFTRNNTVRRHIAREHKTELSLKAFQPPQVPQGSESQSRDHKTELSLKAFQPPQVLQVPNHNQ